MTELHWTAGVHHDGSNLYVSNPLPTLGETVTMRLRVPVEAPIKSVFLRTAPDGENHLAPMQRTEADARSAYWMGQLTAVMPLNTYRFKLLTDEGAYYLNALGISRATTPDWFDFKLLVDFQAVPWLDDAVFYQIFPDRFCNGDPTLDHQPGAWKEGQHSVQFSEWDAPPIPWTQGGNLDFYGGDLPGISQKLGYLHELGINALYLNPIFVSNSNHRYNIHDFYNVDPYLGGNEALVELRQALDDADMRLMLDITPNHTGAEHEWFLEAQQNADADTADYYTFHDHPDDYLSWLGVPTLPKLNYNNQNLREVMYRRDDSVMQFWMRPPYRIDGWRLDVFNMTARQGKDQRSDDVHREMREALKTVNPELYILGEHFFDGTAQLQGDQVDAVMNYQGFNIPMWRWLAGHDLNIEHHPERADPTHYPTEAFTTQINHYRAAVPWVVARQQFNQLDSHDTTRILTICGGNKALVKLAVAILMTYPGVPCLYYGTEIGLPGDRDPDNRRTMPWDDADQWDGDLLDFHKRIIALRKSAPALRHGGYQQLLAEGGLWVYQRQSPEQRLIVVGYRGPESLPSGSLLLAQAGILDGTALVDLLGDLRLTVENGAVTLPTLNAGDFFILEGQA
jgi:alpha-glucosidase